MTFIVTFHRFGYDNEVIVVKLPVEADTQTEAILQVLGNVPVDWELIDANPAGDPEPIAWRYILAIIIIFIVITCVCRIL